MIHEEVLELHGDRRATLFEHPNSRVTFRGIEIPTRGVLRFGLAIDPNVWDKPGDGVTFSAEVRDSSSDRTASFQRYVDPRTNLDERRWLDVEIDLFPFVGSSIEIALATDCGPENNADFDWAHWGDPTVALTGKPAIHLLNLLGAASLWSQQVEMVTESLFIIKDDLRQVLAEHPDTIVRFPGIAVPNGATLTTAIGINEIAWPKLSRGVTFRILIDDLERGARCLFEGHLDPANRKADRGWREIAIPLPLEDGREVAISFQTVADPGPEREPMWAGWSEPQISVARAAGRSSRRPAARPNVLLITLDTVRADHLGCYGRRSIRTPNLDWLASQGALFESCFSQSNVTLPSHLAILSSRSPSQHTRDNNPIALAPSLATLGPILSARGYDTGSVVSVEILNAAWCRGIDRGFRAYRGVRGGRRLGSLTLAMFQDWLGRRGADPFFAWLHFFDAHAPYHPPRSHHGLYLPGGGEPIAMEGVIIPEELQHYRSWLGPLKDLRVPLSQYDAEISYVDALLGELLQDLDERRALANTIIAVTADHGESLGERGVFFDHVGLHDTVTHVPLILSAPGRVRPGTRTPALTMSVDILPTLLDLLDLPALPGAEGRSLLPVVGGERGREVVHAEHSRDAQGMVRTDRYKYIRSTADYRYSDRFAIRSGDEELYNVAADPSESRNLAASLPDVLRDLRALMDDRLRREAAPPAARVLEGDAGMAEKLRSLGYF
jgi:arylsulfatase A-like enzyme